MMVGGAGSERKGKEKEDCVILNEGDKRWRKVLDCEKTDKRQRWMKEENERANRSFVYMRILESAWACLEGE